MVPSLEVFPQELTGKFLPQIKIKEVQNCHLMVRFYERWTRRLSPFLLILIQPAQVARGTSKNKGEEGLLGGRSKSVLGFASRQWMVIGLQTILLVWTSRWQEITYRKCFCIPKALSSRSTVSNAVVKRNLHLDSQLDAGKAANLFSASRRFKVFASLAVTHNVIVSLLLNLQSSCIGLV